MERKKPLRADPEKTREWQARSAKKAATKKRVGLARKPVKKAAEKVREVMSKANPPRVDTPKRKPEKRPGHANPGNNPTPPLADGAKCCAPGCGKTAVHNHHVVYRQQLRRLRKDAGDPRSCVPMCFQHHGDHHGPNWKLPLSVLPDATIEFALDAMGPACYDYLLQRYAGDDPRLDRIIEAEGAT